MFSSLIAMMETVPEPSMPLSLARASSTESVGSAVTVDQDSNAPSSSTPPTSIGDSVSVSSTSLKLDTMDPVPEEPTPGRSRRNRKSVGTYNVKVLSGTAIHAPKKFSKDPAVIEALAARRRTISGDTLIGNLATANSSSATIEKPAKRLVSDGIDALDLQQATKRPNKVKKQSTYGRSPWLKKNIAKSLGKENRKPKQSASEKLESITEKLTVLGKRTRDAFEEALSSVTKSKRELMNLADTDEFAHLDTAPVLEEVWSNGKLVVSERPSKKRKTAAAAAASKTQEVEKPVENLVDYEKRGKIWLPKGLYAGQAHQDLNWFKDCSTKQQKDMEDVAPFEPNKFFPLPMWHGQRLLEIGRDFKLPFDTCNPTMPNPPKVEGWKKTTSNRFIGDAAAQWRKSKLFDSFSSKCVCTPEHGCGDNCQNKVMLYECDDTNCGAGRAYCSNRAFAELTERRNVGGKYRIGVEVMKTEDRGYGVRSNRCFDANQIIVEYTGEIITEEECDRRMNNEYKKNECYYLMMFEQGMILDATKGSIARFVNHSCSPNCRMVKWYVGGVPRMALFAGNKPISTGEELTYDYNFDPFSQKNIQECRCGSDNCRRFLGPKPKDVKPIKEIIKDVVKAGVAAGKRKLKELLAVDSSDEEFDAPSPKKRKMKAATGVKRSNSSGLQAARAAKAAKAAKAKLRGASHILKTRTAPKRVMKKTLKASLLKSNGRGQLKVSSRKSTLTVVEDDGSLQEKKNNTTAVAKKMVRKSAVKEDGREKSRIVKPKAICVIPEPIDPDETEIDESFQ